MDQKRGSADARCSVIGSEKIAQSAGGSKALCAEIEKALANVGHTGSATVEVQVHKSHLSASVKLANGRALPEIGFAMSDAPLSSEGIRRFAVRIATAVRDGAT